MNLNDGLKKFKVLFLGLAFILFLPAAEADAATNYYVDINNVGGTCNDTNTGSISQPFCTVTKALTEAGAGDSIYLRAGTYPLLNINKSGTAGNYITISNYLSETVTVEAGATTGDSIRFSNVSYVRLKGIRATNANGSYNAGIHIFEGGNNIIENSIAFNNTCTNCFGIFIDSSSNNTIKNNQVYGNYESGIVGSSNTQITSGNNITGNTVYNHTLGAGNSDGIKLQGEDTYSNTIQNNLVYGNSDDGIDTWTSSGNIIKGNTARNQGGAGDGNGFKLGGNLTSSGDNTVAFNIAYDNENNGFDTNGGGGNNYYNNVAYTNGHYGFEDGWRMGGCNTVLCASSFVNNIGLDNTTGNFSAGEYTEQANNNIWYDSALAQPKISYQYTPYTTLASFYTASGNALDNPNAGLYSSYSVEPVFINKSSKNFNLQLLSPAIDKGSPANPAGGTVSGAYIDIGAYEFSAQTYPVYRFWSDNYKRHFYTISETEKNNIIANNPNWQFEGTAYRAYSISSCPEAATEVYRFWSDVYKGHFYTASAAERDAIISSNPNWNYEGVAYCALTTAQPGSTPVYRFWSDNYQGHFYTVFDWEKTAVEGNPNWKYEFISFYVF